MLHAVILAGGFGTRLWPASRKAKPKHLLTLGSNTTLIQSTLDRTAALVPPQNVRIVTAAALTEPLHKMLPLFPADQIWSEPHSKNTTAAIGWAAVRIRRIDPDAVMIILPADHVIQPVPVFCRAVNTAVEFVTKMPKTLITFGVMPVFPATTYGYIQRGTAVDCPICPVFRVSRFCEKPNRKTAESFLQSGGYYWNSGIFVWKAETILNNIRRFEPAIGEQLDNIASVLETPEEQSVTEKCFAAMKSAAIDYAVMEKADSVIVLEAGFDWNDIGTWSALDSLYADRRDTAGNIAADSELLTVLSSNCTVFNDDPNRLIAMVGIENTIVIQTENATLIVKKGCEESVRHITEELWKRDDDRWR